MRWNLDSELADVVGTGNQLSQLKGRWEKLSSDNTESVPTEVFASHSALINELILLQIHAADQSGFVLDTDNDANHLANFLVNDIPMLSELAGQARGLGGGIIATGEMDSVLHDKLLEKKVALQVVIENARFSIDYAAKSNPLITEKLGALSSQLLEQSASFSNLIEKVLQDPMSAGSSSKLYWQRYRINTGSWSYC